ncbi:MAG: sigma-54 interaction domain-containing protein [Planctomycetota bacterium]
MQRRSEELGRELAARHVASQPRLSDFISNSPVMAAFIRLVQRVARSDASLLILGETGVGKERLARAIHAEGSRARNPFVAVNCGALPEALLESELFGHREGAFTGAKRDRRGLFELAHRGTIFLDEIGDMPLHLQVKLLRVLQERTFRRLGGDRDLTVDIRVVAATNVDLKAQVETRQFRQDLYYRLGVVTLTIPPLRERRADIPKLIGDYIAHFGAKLGSDVASMSEQALERCLTYSWPGNVRELINVVERAMLLADGDVVRADDLPASIGGYTSLPPLALAGERPSPASELSGEPGATPADLRELEGWFSLPLREARQRWERLYLASLLRETSGRIGETAARAGLSTRVLHDYMKRYGLRKEAFRKPQGPREP